MNNKKTQSGAFAVTMAIVVGLWAFLVIVLNLAMDLSWKCWGSMTCVGVALAIAEGYLFLRKTPGGQSAETSALSIIIMSLYMVVVLLLNTIFCLVSWGDFNWGVIALNVILDVGFIILIIWSGKFTKQVAEKIEKTVQKVGATKQISRKVGELLGLANDAEVRQALLTLKESVDYSTNITTEATEDLEIRMSAQLDDLAQLMFGDTSTEILLNKIKAAQTTWKMRNSVAASDR